MSVVYQDKNKQLENAVKNNDLILVKYLKDELDKKSDFKNLLVKDRECYRAAFYGHLEMVQYFVSIGANIHIEYNWALKKSSEAGHLNVVKYLVSIGAKVNEQGPASYQFDSLVFSAENGHLKVVEFLISVGADVNSSNCMALRKSSVFGHLEVVKCLVESGANACDDETMFLVTFIDMKLVYVDGNLEIIKLDTTNELECYEKCQLIPLYDERVKIVRYLVSKGADINNQSYGQNYDDESEDNYIS